MPCPIKHAQYLCVRTHKEAMGSCTHVCALHIDTECLAKAHRQHERYPPRGTRWSGTKWLRVPHPCALLTPVWPSCERVGPALGRDTVLDRTATEG